MTQPYEGLKILDLTDDLGRYATRLFADLGAEVLRVEPPHGANDRRAAQSPDDPAARCEFEFFNASKSAIALDTTTAEGRRTFAELARDADAIVVERGAALYDAFDWLREVAPHAVLASVSPFGRTGPLADAPSSDLVLQAAGGIAWLSGQLDDAPLRLPGSQSTMVTGVYLAVALSVALFDAQASGEGHVIEISAQEAIAHSLQNSIQVYDFEKRISMRGGEGTRDASENVFACKDGYVFLAAPRTLGVSWNALMTWIGQTGHAALHEFETPRWADRQWRLTREAKDVFRRTIEPFFAQFTKDDITREGMQRKIVLGPASTLCDVLADPQLAHTDYFRVLDDTLTMPGAPYRFSENVWKVSPAPGLPQRVAHIDTEEVQ
ncbi:CoA transferase [Caballeronia sp. LZ035]|uniref:CaiB/BaiF CoA transferase family protein n=1 Tax=Caballeronia sp. LZ035 TaxID=3038568 RepID=UPI00285D7288|nr:CoA transferase [Caballeronia sp. LZ035]MDR5759568.1 CoA transferase [Caballeronia sp. LZ035]